MVAASVSAQRYRPNVDPETREGLLLQQIQQERDSSRRVSLTERLVAEYPKSESILWAYEELSPVYFEAKDWDKLQIVSEKLYAADPSDLDAAQNCLHAVEAKKNIEQQVRWANLILDLTAKSTGDTPPAGIDGPEWKKQSEYAKQVQAYAEFALFQAANQITDPKKKAEFLSGLEKRNPKYAKSVVHTELDQYKKSGNISLLEQAAAKDPKNEDILANLVDHYFRTGNLEKVLFYTNRTIEVLSSKERPEKLSEEEWQSKKANYLRQSYYAAGMLSSSNNRFSQADRYLRSALPYLRSNDQMMAAALYHLGYVNYRLAEVPGEKNRIFDALKFTEQCIAFRSSYTDQAQKNILAIKSEYNLQ